MPIWVDRTKQPISCEWWLANRDQCRHLAIGWYRAGHRRDDLPAVALCPQHLKILRAGVIVEVRQVSGPDGN